MKALLDLLILFSEGENLKEVLFIFFSLDVSFRCHSI